MKRRTVLTSLLLDEKPGLQGSQKPRISHVPEYLDTAGDEAADVYALAGGELDPWQKLVLRQSMGEMAGGRWSAFEVGLLVSRQNGKDEILLARELWGLFVGGERLIIHSAHKFDTAMEHLERLVSLIENVPEFRKRVSSYNRANGKEGITLRSGQRIRFRARTRSGGGRGYTGDCVIFNEAMDLPDEIVGAIMPVMSARSMGIPGPQLWFAGSAVDQTTMANGLVFTRIREAGLAGENDRMAWFEWSAGVKDWLEAHGLRYDPLRPDVDQITPAMLADPVVRAQANPALGKRISPEHVETEFRSPSMSPRQYAIERLSIGDPPDTSGDAGRIISREAWEAAAEHNPENRIVEAPVAAVDANPDMTWASIAISGKRADGLFNGAVVAHDPDTVWIVDECLALKKKHPRIRFVIHKQGPLGSHIDDFKRAKLKVIEANTEDYARACVGLLAGVAEGRFRYPHPQPELDQALAGARAKSGEAMRWMRRDAESADISPLVAVTLAFWGAEQAKGRSQIINLNDLD
jgi:hypothetical protein